MKRILLLLAFSFASFLALSQQNGQGQNSYKDISAPNSNVMLAMRIDSQTQWTNFRNKIPNQFSRNYVFLKDAKKIDLSFMIPKDSLKFYRYTITVNDTTIIASNSSVKGNGKDINVGNISIGRAFDNLEWREIAIGSFDIKNKKVTILYYKITNPGNPSIVTILNKPIQSVGNITAAITGASSGVGFIKNIETHNINIKLHGTSEIERLIISMRPRSYSFLYHVSLRSLSTGKTVHLPNNWLQSYVNAPQFMMIDASYFEAPDDYEVTIGPEPGQGGLSNPITFESKSFIFSVLKSSQSFSQAQFFAKLGIAIFIVMLLSVIIIFLINKNNKRNLRSAIQKTDYAQVQLSAIRLQLNPHFIFNALTGIQSLINKNLTEQANHYLVRFSRLTRNILNNADLISIENELILLNDYLEMEQLRFGFLYNVTADPQIDLPNTDIPSMLLQPLLENAVKHGIANLGNKGIIEVALKKDFESLIITVTDNGEGFDINKKEGGMGLQLIKNRIGLLNKVYPASNIEYVVMRDNLKTIVKVILNGWI